MFDGSRTSSSTDNCLQSSCHDHVLFLVPTDIKRILTINRSATQHAWLPFDSDPFMHCENTNIAMSSKPLAGTKSSGAHSSNTARNVALTFAVALLAFLAQRSWSVDNGHQTSIVSELGPKLSPNATIILPKDPDFAAATQRWVEYQAPTFGAVVVVRDEQDVQQTVRIACPSYRVKSR